MSIKEVSKILQTITLLKAEVEALNRKIKELEQMVKEELRGYIVG